MPLYYIGGSRILERDTEDQIMNNCFAEMCSGSKAGSHSRLMGFCITELSRLASNEEKKKTNMASKKKIK